MQRMDMGGAGGAAGGLNGAGNFDPGVSQPLYNKYIHV